MPGEAEMERAREIVEAMPGDKRRSFLRDTREDDWRPPMWIRAYDYRLIDYHPYGHAGPWLSWTDLGLAVRAALRLNPTRDEESKGG